MLETLCRVCGGAHPNGACTNENYDSESPEKQSQEIANSWIKIIPKEDREISDAGQVEDIIYVLCASEDKGSHLFSSGDKLGNCPDNIRKAMSQLEKGEEGASIAGVAKAMREFAQHPIELSGETDKVNRIANGALPESVRTALLSIILKEGKNSAVEMFNYLADKIESVASGDEMMRILSETVVGFRSDKQSDNMRVRREAARKVLEAVYPDIVNSEEMKIIQKFDAEDRDPSLTSYGSILDERKKDFLALVGREYVPSEETQTEIDGAEATIKDEPDMADYFTKQRDSAIASDIKKQVVAYLMEKAVRA